MIYTGKTKNLGVIGCPISHSLSPVIQNTVLQSMNLNYVYIALPVAPDKLADAVQGLKALCFTGFNITIPHKIKIMQYIDEIDEAAKFIGAVNTVVIKNDQLFGYNTDYEGFLAALEHCRFSVKDINATVLGSGGVARAIVYGLLRSGVNSLAVVARNKLKAKALADRFLDLGNVHAHDWTEKEYNEILSSTDLLVNATSLGMEPKIDAMPPVDMTILSPKALVYDVIYTPEKTKLLIEAEKSGHAILNGEYMLAGQGVAALKKWTGCQNINMDLMRIALHKALGKRI